MPYVNGLLKKKGLQQLVQKCYLDLGLERTVDMLDALKNLGLHLCDEVGSVDRHRRPGHPGQQAAAGPERAQRGDQGRTAVSGRRDHQRRAVQQGDRRLVGGDREDCGRDVRRDGRARPHRPQLQPGLHHGRLGRARLETADPTARGDARSDGQAVGRDHRDADHVELPRRPHRAAVLHLDARREEGVWRTRRSRPPTPAT